jgi:transketolase
MDQRITEGEKFEEIANRLRVNVIKMIGKSGFGHAGGSMSIVEILTVLYFSELRIDPKNPAWEDRDRFVLSKGHAAPVFYAVLSERGYFPEDLLVSIHQVDSCLQCHPDMTLCPGVDISTGALGQGLSVAVGMALGGKFGQKTFRVYALLGDGEIQEGQVWEAAMSAAKFKLDNLVAILDYNKLELSGKISEVMPLEPLHDKWTAFGWHVIETDGHSFTQIMGALEAAKKVSEKPTLILAHTVKGCGISFMEHKVEWHAVSMSPDQVHGALKELKCAPEEIDLVLSQIKGR